MSLVTEKKRKTGVKAEEQKDTDSFLFRPPDPKILIALKEHAKKTHRSVNMALLTIIEEALGKAGLWPPPSTD